MYCTFVLIDYCSMTVCKQRFEHSLSGYVRYTSSHYYYFYYYVPMSTCHVYRSKHYLAFVQCMWIYGKIYYLIAEIWDFRHFCKQKEWKIVRQQGRIQDFHLGGGGGAKDSVPARTLRARNRTHFRQGSRN